MHRMCNSKYSVPKKISVVFHNRANCIIMIIKVLAEEFKKKFSCLGENTKKYMTFTILIGQEISSSNCMFSSGIKDKFDEW